MNSISIDEHGSAYVNYKLDSKERRGAAVRTQRVNDRVLIDFDESGEMIGVELLNIPPQQ